MCIFTDRVEKVSSTNIFAALVDPYTQLTVYSNKVALAGTQPPPLINSPTFFNSNFYDGSQFASQFASLGDTNAFPPAAGHNVFWEPQSQWSAFKPDGMQVYDTQGTPVAMVLPVPLVSGNASSIKMVDMSNVKDFFTKLKDTMPSLQTLGATDGTYTFESKNGRGAPMLAVKRCGPYRYSVVPDVESFKRLRQNVFRVNPRVFTILQRHYPRGYGFLVCIIDRSAEFSPIAYVHPSDGRNLFIPTLHEHGHPGEEVYTHDWDHAIYTIDKDEGTRLTDKRVMTATVVRAATKPDLPTFKFRNLDWSRLKQRTIDGYNPNGDVLIRA